MKIILYMAMSLNGYIAKEGDETPWSDEIWKSYYKIAKQFQTIILGRRTYDIMKENSEFEKIGNPFTIIVSSNKNMKNKGNFYFVKYPKEAIEILKNKGFTEALLGGGSKINSSFMKDNLVGEIILDVEPVVFGKGIKLFAEGDFEKKLKLIEMKKISNDLIQLNYEVRK